VIVVTDRLRLEPIGVEHSADLYRLHQDRAINEWWDTTWSPEDAAAQATRYQAGWTDDGVSKWMAYDRTTSALIGRGGITRMDVAGADRLEVGWAVLGRYWGMGCATEMGTAALAFAFHDLAATEVVAFTEPHNLRSRAVMDRLGMTYRHDFERDGFTFVLYAISSPPMPCPIRA
jgi:RimJ/RimL family protein N-acetyltransferase